MKAKTLEQRIQRLEDIHEIANLMGRYVFLHEVERDYEFPDTIYAQKTSGVSFEVATSGVWVGLDHIRQQFSNIPGVENKPKVSRKGAMFVHPLTTPVIEVAGDGKTAKGVWMAPGYEGGAGMGDEQPMAGFVYTKYGCDFVKEDGKWKVWHYHVYRVFMTPWNIPYTDEWEKNVRDKSGKKFGTGKTPDFPTTADNPYSLETSRELVPAPPEPYETFADTFSYGPPEK